MAENNSRFSYLSDMSTPSSIADLRDKYIRLTKEFFSEIEKGREPVELQELQSEIEKTLLELDRLEKLEKESK